MFISIFIRLHGIDRRKLEKNTGLPVLWIPLQIFEKVIFFYFNLLESFYFNQRIIIYFFT